jgi:hypothetical protein
VFTRYFGALLRAFLVVLLVATPSLLEPGGSDSAPIILLVALFSGWLVFSEYTADYPSLVEFRDAPPFNRLRFGSLLLTVLILSIIQRGTVYPTAMSELFTSVGTVVGNVLDFPFSPVRLLLLTLPENATAAEIMTVQRTAGLAYLVSLIALCFFALVLWVNGWPRQRHAFNVWTNLPTFDPTGGGDVVSRLNRDANFNVALGVLLPFLIPAVLQMASGLIDPIDASKPQTLIWSVAAWAFLPASLLMRGIATARVAHMIADKRRRSQHREDGDELHAFG